MESLQQSETPAVLNMAPIDSMRSKLGSPRGTDAKWGGTGREGKVSRFVPLKDSLYDDESLPYAGGHHGHPNVSLPDPMKAWVEQQSAEGRYANTSDYVRDLIRRDQVRSDARMQDLVDDELRSGDGTRSMAKIKAEARRKSARLAEG